ncbi:MAG: hypothetical protein ACRCSU_04940 [Paracoccaceae bacterium]
MTTKLVVGAFGILALIETLLHIGGVSDPAVHSITVQLWGPQ